MTAIAPKLPTSKNKPKGKFKNEAEFLADEKQRFDAIFGHVNWSVLKTSEH